jgi:hypothetical protein
MIFKALGTLDLVTVFVLLGAAILPEQLLFVAAVYMIVKGGVFTFISKDLASVGDFIAGIYLLVLAFGLKIPILHPIILLYLAQKTLLTFVSMGIKSATYFSTSKKREKAVDSHFD